MGSYKWCCCRRCRRRCCYHCMNPFGKIHCCRCNSYFVTAEANHKYCRVMWYLSMDLCNWMYCMVKQRMMMMDRPNSLADYSCTMIANCLAIVNQTTIAGAPRAERFVNEIETTLLCLRARPHSHTQQELFEFTNRHTIITILCKFFVQIAKRKCFWSFFFFLLWCKRECYMKCGLFPC